MGGPGDDRPVGDPRDPRGDLDRRRDGRPLVPRVVLLVGAVLLGVALWGLRDVIGVAPGAVVDALVFGLVVIALLGGGVLWADRRWPQRAERRGPPEA